MQKKTIFITGVSGYVGFLVMQKMLENIEVEKVIALDKEDFYDYDRVKIEKYFESGKLKFIKANTFENYYFKEVSDAKPDTVIHIAWQIREIYGDRKTTHNWNILGSRNIFKFAFENTSVKNLIYFSTIASYGAYPENTFADVFTEDKPFRKSDYLYAEEKRICEEVLDGLYKKAAEENIHTPVVSIIRPASITGPRLHLEVNKFGLQSALSGSAKGGVYTLVSYLTSFMPGTEKWVRQYVHEADIVNAVEFFTFQNLNHKYEAFNLCPDGSPIFAKDMAEIVNKKLVILPVQFVKIVFYLFWHLTRGKVPTAPGVWKGYSYPIVVDGSKISKMYNFVYKYKSREAISE